MQKNLDQCQFAVAMDSIVGKWKPIIIHHLLQGKPLRFNELRRLLPDITQRMLTLHLRELEEEEIITRVVYPQIPPKVEYSITEYGMSLTPIIEALHQWGATHIERKKLGEAKKQIEPD
ncbi:MAG: transcriptional regulator [Paenibacillus sp.]|jgi:DNA-binding HxlR family transcriptional regulator|uniref:Winged helix-turn-helix transcriptional regulator n=1 Tax=Paenibacillus hemerocallicola TaxID=1172614 RepID=A0A5C4T3Z3_9BACL|nr:winged helix-turn-helix transcriptional regulator [Paenibacillus hemerocallicola]MDF2651869.1 transcriptional regulator [Paenibacillus sp.]TNJ63017.1 winged helix-turn-helix transcriptional regulator [Paenibacillus hemerocallicola]